MTKPRAASVFRNPFGQRWTRQLFYECQQELPIEDRLIEPIFSLHDDREGLVNLRRVYVELGDPTGYQLAVRHLENYAHWQLLLKSPWFREAKELWDAELDAKLSSEGLSAIRAYADGIEGVAPAVQLTAARYLADKAYRKEAKAASAPRGRPSKAEVAGNLKRETAASADIASDLARIQAVR